MAFQHSSVGVRMRVGRSRSEGREWKEGVQVPMQVGQTEQRQVRLICRHSGSGAR